MLTVVPRSGEYKWSKGSCHMHKTELLECQIPSTCLSLEHTCLSAQVRLINGSFSTIYQYTLGRSYVSVLH